MNDKVENPTTSASRAPTILIIDDDPDNLGLMLDCLDGSGYTALVAEDGESGLKRACYARPDLILLDVLMPGIDGFETCRRLKAAESTKDIPVIFMTALAETEHKLKGFGAGAVDYIIKPFQREEVLARVGVHLRIRELTNKLQEANESLEKRVEVRTVELAGANAQLQAEINERKQTEQALRKSEAKYRTIFEHSGTALMFIEEDMRITLINKAFETLSGYSGTEVEGKKSWTEFVADKYDLERMKEYHHLRRTDPEAAPHTYGFQFLDREGHVKDVVVSVVLIPGTNKSLASILDITERKRAEEALSESKNYLDKIINSVADPIFVKDRQHRWVLLNDAYCSFMGYTREELLGKSDYDFFLKSDADVFWSMDETVFTTGVENMNEEGLTDAKGVVHSIVTRKKLYTDEKGEKFIVAIIRDITERKRLEEQLRQAVKMEAIGTLAGGVAHDFNNLMTAVIGYSDLLLLRMEEGSPLRKDIEQIRKAGERAASLTSQLLAFSRKQVLQPKVLDLNCVVADTEKMLKRLIGEDITLSTMPDPALERVIADPGLIEQVIMNLAINARDAMPRGGKLTIETANVYLDETYARLHIGVEPGHYVLLAVSDTGVGMDAETLSHIFEPFFTTKEKGKGTGLGLATVYGIVKQSDGHIWVYSEPGRGATFKVYLPRAEEYRESVRTDTCPLEVVEGGSETILLVEDDEVVRALATKSLRMKGYNVLEARHGRDALKILREHKGSVQLLVTDVVMPEMSGRELAQEIELRYPDMKVLYISGYTDNAIVHHGVLDAGTAFLQKPFTPDALALRVRRVLDGPKET